MRKINYHEKGRTINSKYYIALLACFKEETAKKWLQIKKKKVIFHQDNAQCHKSIAMMAKLHELHFELLPHPPYSPDLAPSNYWLFADLKRFGSSEEVISETKRVECERVRQEVSEAKDIEMKLSMHQLELERKEETNLLETKFQNREEERANEISLLRDELHQMSKVWSTKLKEEKTKIQMQADQFEKMSQETISSLQEDMKQLQQSHQKNLANLAKQHEENIKEVQESGLCEQKSAIDALQIAHQTVLNRLKSEHGQKLNLQQEKLQQEFEKHKDLLKNELNEKHRQELNQQVEIQVKEVASIKQDLDELVEISKKKEKDHLKETEKLKEEIERQEKFINNLKCDVEKFQKTIDELLAELEGKKQDLEEIKFENQQKLKELEEMLVNNAQEEKENLQEDHIEEMQQLVSEFNRAQQLLKNKISVLNMELLQSEERFKNRESRPEDLEEICKLRNSITDRESQMKKFQAEKRFFQMELINRETNFNKIFGSTPQVGVINPLNNKKVKGGDKNLRKFTSAPSLQQAQQHNRLEHLPGSPVHDEDLNPVRPLPPMQPPPVKKYIK